MFDEKKTHFDGDRSYHYREGDKSYSANITTLDKDTALSLVDQNHKVASDFIDKTLDISREFTTDRKNANDEGISILKESLRDQAEREKQILAEEREAMLRKIALEAEIKSAEMERDRIKAESEHHKMSENQAWFYRIFYPLVGIGLGIASYFMLNPQIWR